MFRSITPRSIRTRARSAALTLAALLAAFALLTGCAGAKKGAASDDPAVQLSELLIQGVEQYKTENGRYPENLQKLVPDQIQELDQAALEDAGLRYKPWKQYSSYRFTFTRDDQLCTFAPEEAEWDCAAQ